MREILLFLPKPSHYTGMEPGCIQKDPANVRLHIALAFPDTYEVGMSYLGQKILYEIVNANPHWWAERVMAPEREAAAILREHSCLLTTLESDTPLNKLAAIGFSVTHELCYTDILHMLDLGGIPLRHEDRPQDLMACPLVMAGGGAMMGAEPLSPFLDLVALGDGEELLPEILALLERARKEGWSRDEFLRQSAAIPGVYVPSLFELQPDGSYVSKIDGYRPKRRIVTDLDACAYPVAQVVPVGAIQNRLALEIARGCTRGCRFCHAGMVYRPVRERSPEVVARLLEECLANTGFDEVSFLALSAGDCTALKTIHGQAHERCQKEQIALALPSLRVGSVDDDIMGRLAAIRRPGCTLAPEAGSQRLRDVINKGITEEGLLLHLRKLLEHGWRQVKLYFMIGLPTETDEDLQAIVELCRKARDAGGTGTPRLQITAAISPFVPKPFTPFQWEAQIDLPEIARRIAYIANALKKHKNIKLKWHSPEVSHLEGILSRGGRELADVIEKAYAKGAIFCSWTENFTLEPWLEALAESGLSPQDYISARPQNGVLPWEHLEAGVSSEFLARERGRAYAGKTSRDCREGGCAGCTACDTPQRPATIARTGISRHRLVYAKRDQCEHAPAINDSGSMALKECKQSRPDLPPQLTQKVAQYRLWHTKKGMSAWLGHLELQATILKGLRRARLPVSFSQGFHPLPLISFGRALPVGVESDAEWFGLYLHERLGPQLIVRKLQPFLPAGMSLTLAEVADFKGEHQSISEKYCLYCAESQLLEVASAFGDFWDKTEYPLAKETRKGIRIEDVRPLLLNWKIAVGEQSGVVFSTDWSRGYFSPLTLARTILAIPAGQPVRLVKLAQTFANGKEYSLTGKTS